MNKVILRKVAIVLLMAGLICTKAFATSVSACWDPTICGDSAEPPPPVETTPQTDTITTIGVDTIGTVILVPNHTTTPTPPTSRTAPVVQSGVAGLSYTVTRGDTLYGIASRHGSTVGAIQMANGMGNSTVLYPGDVLIIPGASFVAPPAQAPPPVQAPIVVTPPSPYHSFDGNW